MSFFTYKSYYSSGIENILGTNLLYAVSEICFLQGTMGMQGVTGYPGPRGIKVSIIIKLTSQLDFPCV